jgi:hypothetical protein
LQELSEQVFDGGLESGAARGGPRRQALTVADLMLCWRCVAGWMLVVGCEPCSRSHEDGPAIASGRSKHGPSTRTCHQTG